MEIGNGYVRITVPVTAKIEAFLETLSEDQVRELGSRLMAECGETIDRFPYK